MNILICHEKHGETYWRADNPQEWAHSTLAILTERWNEEWYYKPKAPEQPTHGPEDIKSDMDKEYRDILTRRWRTYLSAQARYESGIDWYDRAKAVVENQDASCVTVGSGKWSRQEPKAWRLLDERSDHEYEWVEIGVLQSARPQVSLVH